MVISVDLGAGVCPLRIPVHSDAPRVPPFAPSAVSVTAKQAQQRPEGAYFVTTRSDLIPVGSPAPDFTCALSDGGTLALSSLRGSKRVILVFYPGDNTPLCTAQLCAFRDDWQQFQSHDTLVYGVNPAGRDKHAQFADRHQFPFSILVDAGGKVAGAYGCRMLFTLVRRTVYVIDKQGRIAFAQRGNPAPHEILRVLETLEDSDIGEF